MAGAGLTAQQQVFSPSDEVPLSQAMDDLPFDLLLSGCGRTHTAALSAKRRALVFRLTALPVAMAPRPLFSDF